ncbi:MAG: ACP S-malonyltransferase [Alphaproteobacteria bacterium]|nr:ACP S-malonyltransferase [Alphaproteobacteria bacterium]
MTKTAFLFPGQGSQTVGMGASLMASCPVARHMVEQVDEALGGELLSIMTNGPEDELKMTRNAQPALMATAVATVRSLEKATGKSIDQMADFVAGHSLGEYSAMTAVHVFDIEVAARLLRHRGDAMQAAVPAGEGAMAALLGVDVDAVENILAGVDGLVEIANDNSAGQVVISGAAEPVNQAIAAAKDAGVRRAMLLPVSAPFHCGLMAPAADTMAEILADTTLYPPALPIVSNVTAQAENAPSDLRGLLVRQVTGRVRWRESLIHMAEQGVTRFVEVGTGKVLTGLIKRTLPDVEAFNIDTADDMDSAVAAL